MAETADRARVGPPLNERQEQRAIILIVLVVCFIGTWTMFGAMMTRMAEYDDHLARTERLERELATLRQMPGPMETGGALVLTTASVCGGAKL